jgi:hypothetical protein
MSAVQNRAPIRAIDVIRKKRDGGELTQPEIAALVDGYTRGEIPDYQASAWLMAVLLKGMTPPESASLTDTMLRSGEVLDFSDMPKRKVDKHSTGGVGDKTSLVLAPVAAAGGLVVPMISGRGLGHTGGTLDACAILFQRQSARRAIPTGARNPGSPMTPDRRDCSRDRKLLRGARCDRHGREPVPDLRLHHEQKAR